MANVTVSSTIDTLLQSADAAEAKTAISASSSGTEIATAGLRAIPATDPVYNTYVLDLDTDTSPALTFTDPVSAPASKYGYSLKVIGKAASDTTITIPSSYSEEQQASITTILVRAGVEFTCYRMYLDGRWHIYGEPSPGSYSYGVKELRSGGAATVAETVPVRSITQSVNLTDGRCELHAIYIDREATLSIIKWYNSVNPNFTADNSNRVGIYSVNVSTKVATLVSGSPSAALTWNPASGVNTWTTRDISASVTPGWYYIAALYNSSAQTTAPGTGSAPSLTNAAVNTLITSLPISAYVTASQTDLPASINLATDITNNTVVRYFQVY